MATVQKPTKKGVPQDARFINKTTFTNTFIKKASAMTVSSVLRMCYMMFGVAMGLVVVVLRSLVLVDNIVTLLVLLMGLLMVWQGYRLPMENARRIISQLGPPDDERRVRTMFATNQVFGIVLDENSTYTFDWRSFDAWAAAPDCITLSLTKQALLIALDPERFEKGDAKDFLAFIQEKIISKPDSAFVRWTRKACYKLDNWKYVKAKALQEEAEKKAAKKEAKRAKKAEKKR